MTEQSAQIQSKEDKIVDEPSRVASIGFAGVEGQLVAPQAELRRLLRIQGGPHASG